MLTRHASWTRLEMRLPEHAYAPRGFAAGDNNLYRYVGNAPTNATDPSGLESVKVVGGVLEDKAKGGTFYLKFAGEKGKVFKVKQWMQLEVYSEAIELGGKAGTGWRLYEVKGMKLDPPLKPGEQPHEHKHVTSIPTAPTLQLDHGGSTDAYSIGPYAVSKDGNSVTYSDTPTAAQVLIPMAQQLLTKEYRENGKNYERCWVRIVQRFVTIAYVNDRAVQTYHWTATSDAAWGAKEGGQPEVAIVGRDAPNKTPTQVVQQWATNRNNGKPD